MHVPPGAQHHRYKISLHHKCLFKTDQISPQSRFHYFCCWLFSRSRSPALSLPPLPLIVALCSVWVFLRWFCFSPTSFLFCFPLFFVMAHRWIGNCTVTRTSTTLAPWLRTWNSGASTSRMSLCPHIFLLVVWCLGTWRIGFSDLQCFVIHSDREHLKGDICNPHSAFRKHYTVLPANIYCCSRSLKTIGFSGGLASWIFEFWRFHDWFQS